MCAQRERENNESSSTMEDLTEMRHYYSPLLQRAACMSNSRGGGTWCSSVDIRVFSSNISINSLTLSLSLSCYHENSTQIIQSIAHSYHCKITRIPTLELYEHSTRASRSNTGTMSILASMPYDEEQEGNEQEFVLDDLTNIPPSVRERLSMIRDRGIDLNVQTLRKIGLEMYVFRELSVYKYDSPLMTRSNTPNTLLSQVRTKINQRVHETL